MDLHVLFDRSGKILAAVDLRRGETPDAVPLPRPVAQRGQRTADVEVPEGFRDLDFLEICTRLIVLVKGDRVTLGARKGAASAGAAVRYRPSPKSMRRKRSKRTRRR